MMPTKLIRKYQAGYRRRPESPREVAAALATAADLLRRNSIRYDAKTPIGPDDSEGS
jgi:hypothetical protein